MDPPMEWILFLLEIVLMMIILYFATRIVCKEDVVTGPYLLRLFVTALLAVVIVPFFEGMLSGHGLGVLGVIIAFLLLVVIIRYVIVSETSLGEEALESVLIAIITVVTIFVINLVASYFFDIQVLGSII